MKVAACFSQRNSRVSRTRRAQGGAEEKGRGAPEGQKHLKKKKKGKCGSGAYPKELGGRSEDPPNRETRLKKRRHSYLRN